MDRYKSTKKASILGIIGNVFLLIIKGIIGFMTNSQAMIADSVNSAGPQQNVRQSESFAAGDSRL